MFVLFGIAILTGFIIGTKEFLIENGFIKSKSFTWYPEEVEPLPEAKETPYYVEEQIYAIIMQLEAYHSTIDRLNESIKYTYDLETLEKLKIKRADTLYKVARLEEKLQKLYEKWDL